MNVVDIRVDQLHPNPWNVNRMTQPMRTKLVRYLKREGLVQPLVVRPHPQKEGEYEILGGEHRWRVCREDLEYTTVPCIVVDLDDKRAKVLSINLNSMSGETVPSLLSRLLSDLNTDMPLDDMAALLPFDTRDIQDTLQLMQLPEGFGDELDREADEHDGAAPTVVTLVLDPTQRETFDRAMDRALEDVGEVKDKRARAAVKMAEVFLAGGTG